MAVARYVAASCVGAQRWVGPAIAYLVAVAATSAAGGDPLAGLSLGAAWMLPIAAWLTLATLNDEDDDHVAITAAAVGGATRLRATKLRVAGSAALFLSSVAIGFAYVRAPFAPADLGAGALAHLATIGGGVTIGMLCARPLISRTGWALLAISLVSLADLGVPDAPPARLTLAALGGDQPNWPVLLACAGSMLALPCLALRVTCLLSR